MQTNVAINGDIVVPGKLAERLGFRPGDSLEATIEAGRIVLFPSRAVQHIGAIVVDAITGLPVIDFGPDAPVLTNEHVSELLAEFP